MINRGVMVNIYDIKILTMLIGEGPSWHAKAIAVDKETDLEVLFTVWVRGESLEDAVQKATAKLDLDWLDTRMKTQAATALNQLEKQT